MSGEVISNQSGRSNQFRKSTLKRSPVILSESVSGYGVRIRRADGSVFLASGRDAGVAMFFAYSRAMDFKKQLARELGLKRRLRVVKLSCVWRWAEPGKNRKMAAKGGGR